MKNRQFVCKMDRFTFAVTVIAFFFAGATIGLGAFAYVSEIAPAAGFDLMVTGVKLALFTSLLPILSVRLMAPEENLRSRNSA